MFHMAKNVLQNFANLKFKIAKHYNNLFIYLYEPINIQIKNIFKLTHKIMLSKTKNKKFYTTNELLNKWKKIKKMDVWIEKLFNVQKTNILQSIKTKINWNKSNMFENKIYTKKWIAHTTL